MLLIADGEGRDGDRDDAGRGESAVSASRGVKRFFIAIGVEMVSILRRLRCIYTESKRLA